jgi:hypothetical protein
MIQRVGFLPLQLINRMERCLRSQALFPTGVPGSFPGPSAMVVYSNFLYVALAGTSTRNNKIAAFAIDSATGELTPLPGSPFVEQIITLVPDLMDGADVGMV